MAQQRTESTENRWRPRGAPWLAALVVVVAFANSIDGPFIYDDAVAIVDNENIRALWPPLRPLTSPPATPVAGRPVVSLTLAINYAVGGLDARGYHVFNIAVHVLAALTLYGIVRRTLRGDALRRRFGRSAEGVALAIAIIWAVHPLQTECVNYITQRTESIMGLFYLVTLYCAIRAWEPATRWRWTAASVLSCALGMASKETMVTAPAMVVLYDWAFRTQPYRQVVRRRRLILYAGLAFTWVILAALMATGPRASTVGFTLGTSAWHYGLNQCVAIVRYLQLVVWPHPLIIDYGFPRTMTVGQAAPYAAVVAGLLIATIVALLPLPLGEGRGEGLRRRAPLGLLGAWFFVVLAPTSSFIPIVTEVAAERRMYLPLAAPVTLIVVVAYLLAEASALRARPRLRPTISAIRTALAAGAVAVLVWTTRQRNEVYRSPLAIWRDAVDAVPDNHRARTNLGIALVLEGRLDGAIAQFQEALEISPRSARAHYNLGNTLASQGRLDEAIEHYRATISARPLTEEAHYNLGVALGQQGKLEDAAASFRVAIDLRPGDADARYHLAVALRGLGARREAIGEARRAVEIQPDHAGAQSLLDVLLGE